MLSIPGLKPEKINILHKELGITDLAALEAAARQDKLKRVKGLGAAVQRKILEGLKIREHAQGSRHLQRADELAVAAAETLEHSLPGLIRAVPAGDLCRGGGLVSNLALVAEIERLCKGPKVASSGEITVPPHRMSAGSGSACFWLPASRGTFHLPQTSVQQPRGASRKGLSIRRR
jgi:DNA polymerase (family 10)